MQMQIKQIIEKQTNQIIVNPKADLQITDKLDQLEIIMNLEEQFNIKIDENAVNPKSLNDYVELTIYARNRLATAS